MNNDGFLEITGKKKIKKKLWYKSINRTEINDQSCDLDMFKKKLFKITLEMESSTFLIKNLEVIRSALSFTNFKNFKRFICLGLGLFTTNVNSLHQLAFFIALSKKLDIMDIEFYDPVFSELEKFFLKSIDIKVTPFNNKGFYTIDCNTLICLPHCPTELTNNILWENWNSNALSKVLLFSNSIENILVRNSQKTIEECYKQIKELSAYTKEFPLDNCYHFDDILNDMSFHIFDLTPQIVLDEEFWIKSAEPVYASSEMITMEVQELNV